MLKIETIKEEIKDFDTDVDNNDSLDCWLYRITTNSNDNKNSCREVTCS